MQQNKKKKKEKGKRRLPCAAVMSGWWLQWWRPVVNWGSCLVDGRWSFLFFLCFCSSSFSHSLLLSSKSALSVKKRGEHALEKQFQIAFQETEFQLQFRVGSTTIKV
jgi:hypothetical protein